MFALILCRPSHGSNIPLPKDILKDLVLAPKNAFRLLVLCGIAIAVFHKAMDEHSPAIALFPLAAAYVLYGVGDRLYLYLVRKNRSPESTVSENVDETQSPSSAGEAPSKSGDFL